MPKKEDKFFEDMLKPVKKDRRRRPLQGPAIPSGPSGPAFSGGPSGPSGPSGPTLSPSKKRRKNRGVDDDLMRSLYG